MLLLIFQLLIPISVLAEGALTPSLSMNSEGNYTVSSVADLNTLRSDIDKGIDYAGQTIILTQDIDLSQVSVPLNSFTTQNAFSGCFDGEFHTISGYTDAKSGLFGLIDDQGCVKDVRIAADVVISDANAFINDAYYDSAYGERPYGLIANECAGTISRCSSTGTVMVNVPCSVGGIAGYNFLHKQIAGEVSILKGKIEDCYSNVIYNNQVDSTATSLLNLSGIVFYAGNSVEHCYFYGQFTGNALSSSYTPPIRNSGCSASTCAYDGEILGFSVRGNTKGVNYTTAQMKDEASYTTLGFDFDKCWNIDPSINAGYPYLDPSKGESGANPDQTAANAVITQIAALPATIILADQSSVQAARAAYDALSGAQKALVSNLATLTAAEAALAQLQAGGDTTGPAITVQDANGLALSDILTVADPSFSFKVTAQDDKDGAVNPSVEFNGTALTAGSDGTYTCTLAEGGNIITITANDAAGNQVQKSLSVTLNSGGEGTSTVVPLDIQVMVTDKTYDPSLSEADNLKADVTSVQIANSTSDVAALIAQYKVQVDYQVNSATLSSRVGGEWPVNVTFNKLDLTYTPNDSYKFVINQVLTPTARLLDDGQSGPDAAKQQEQVAEAKQAQTILYNSIGMGQGEPTFTWEGDKASTPGQEGTVVFTGTDIWQVFSAARFGYSGVRAGYYDDWFQSVQTGLQAMKDAGIGPQDVEMTEWEKLVLAITAIGYDPRDIKAYDLIDILSNEGYLQASKQIMAQQYALLALNSYNYPIPATGNRFDKEAWIHGVADGYQPVNLTNSDAVRVVDMGVMQYQPIAAYYNPNAQEGAPYYDVKVAMDNALALYSAAQTDLGYFYGGGGMIYTDDNPWNNAQVYMTLGMAKVNPFDVRFIKNGYSLFDAALAKFNLAAGTCLYNSSTYDPGQIGRGLDSLVRDYEGRNNIFDCTDVVNSTVPVNNAIAALPETVTSAAKTQVDAAEALYSALSDAQKASLQDAAKAKLAAAETAVGGGDDQTAANAVIAQIGALPDSAAITLADQSSIKAARAAYNVLSDVQKALVSNLDKLTAAEAALAQLGGDTGTPVITLTDQNGQTLRDNLTVTDPSFSFKATVQDEKDGTLAPGVELNGTALTAGSDGTYTCTLSEGSNTLTVSATDSDGHQAVKNLTIKLGSGSAAFTIQRVGDDTFHNGQDVRLEVKVSNQTSASQDAVLIVALYRTDAGSQMVNYAYVSKTVKAGDQEDLGAGFTVPESGTYVVKGFVWNNWGDMEALMAQPAVVNVAQS